MIKGKTKKPDSSLLYREFEPQSHYFTGIFKLYMVFLKEAGEDLQFTPICNFFFGN